MTSLIDARVTDLTAEEFSVLIEAVAFGDRRVFLWGGRVCEKMAKTNAHAFVAERVSLAVRSLLPPDWMSWHENPIRLGRKHVPLPDFSVVRGPLDRYRRKNPRRPMSGSSSRSRSPAWRPTSARGRRGMRGRWCPVTGWPMP